jgi:hypothetical protein
MEIERNRAGKRQHGGFLSNSRESSSVTGIRQTFDHRSRKFVEIPCFLFFCDQLTDQTI